MSKYYQHRARGTSIMALATGCRGMKTFAMYHHHSNKWSPGNHELICIREQTLALMLPYWPVLEKLEVSGRAMTFSALLSAVNRHCPQLRSFDIRNPGDGSSTAADWVDFVRKHPHLQVLSHNVYDQSVTWSNELLDVIADQQVPLHTLYGRDDLFVADEKRLARVIANDVGLEAVFCPVATLSDALFMAFPLPRPVHVWPGWRTAMRRLQFLEFVVDGDVTFTGAGFAAMAMVCPRLQSLELEIYQHKRGEERKQGQWRDDFTIKDAQRSLDLTAKDIDRMLVACPNLNRLYLFANFEGDFSERAATCVPLRDPVDPVDLKGLCERVRQSGNFVDFGVVFTFRAWTHPDSPLVDELLAMGDEETNTGIFHEAGLYWVQITSDI
jgi:hypothetical protein